MLSKPRPSSPGKELIVNHEAIENAFTTWWASEWEWASKDTSKEITQLRISIARQAFVAGASIGNRLARKGE